MRVPGTELGDPRPITGLGRLAELDVSVGRRRLRWRFAPRPVLAYDYLKFRPMWIVGGHYRVWLDGQFRSLGGPDPLRPTASSSALRAAIASYTKTHWGLRPPGFVSGFLVIPDQVWTMAYVNSVVYATAKRGDGFSLYEHAFDTRPSIAINEQGTQLFWVGGRYTVDPPGIVG